MTCCVSALPAEITAGLDFQARVLLSAYPAPAWTLQAVLRGPAPIDLTATADGAEHVFTANAATTAAWAAGTYWYSLRASNGASTVEVEKGRLIVEADLAAVTGVFDGRTENEKALDAINAVLAKRATMDQQRYVINNRELWRTPIADLLKLKTSYVAAVRRERARASGCGGIGRQIPVRFSG
jgi:hypothetical protein